MATWDTGTEEFICPKCGAQYKSTFRDYPAPDPSQSFECLDCGETVHSWRGTRDYYDRKLLKHGAGAQREAQSST